MKVVYVVCSGHYEDYMPDAVCPTREIAEAVVAGNAHRDPSIEEIPMLESVEDATHWRIPR